MSAKTVVFTAEQKFDGVEFRNISSCKYIQMSGCAGRRLVDREIVIMMCDEKLESTYMLERCFFQFQSSAGILALEDGTQTLKSCF